MSTVWKQARMEGAGQVKCSEESSSWLGVFCEQEQRCPATSLPHFWFLCLFSWCRAWSGAYMLCLWNPVTHPWVPPAAATAEQTRELKIQSKSGKVLLTEPADPSGALADIEEPFYWPIRILGTLLAHSPIHPCVSPWHNNGEHNAVFQGGTSAPFPPSPDTSHHWAVVSSSPQQLRTSLASACGHCTVPPTISMGRVFPCWWSQWGIMVSMSHLELGAHPSVWQSVLSMVPEGEPLQCAGLTAGAQ